MPTGVAVFRCGQEEHSVELSLRDVRILDGRYFLENATSYRPLFGLDFIAGLGAPPVGKLLKTFGRYELRFRLEGLLKTLESQRDLLLYDYQYEFGDTKGERHSGGTSGFLVNGLQGRIRAYPGYCDLTLCDRLPDGQARVVQIIDMRAMKRIATDNRGELRVVRRKAQTGWFDVLPSLIAWLEAQSTETVDILHAR